MIDAMYQASTDMAMNDQMQRPAPSLPSPQWYEQVDWQSTGLGFVVAGLLLLFVVMRRWRSRSGPAPGERWWWVHVAFALGLFVAVAGLEEWARHSYPVMQLLAGVTLAGAC